MFFEHYWRFIAVGITVVGLLLLFAFLKVEWLGKPVERVVIGFNRVLWRPLVGRLWQAWEKRMGENRFRKLEATLDRRRVEALSDAMISEQSRQRKGDL